MACWDNKGRKAKHLVGYKASYPRAGKLPSLGLDHLVDTHGSGKARQVPASAGVRVKSDGLKDKGTHGYCNLVPGQPELLELN